MEFGHWIGVGWERGGGRQGDKGDEDNSGLRSWRLGDACSLRKESRGAQRQWALMSLTACVSVVIET